MSFEVDRPIQLLGAASSELIKDDINHALASNAISTNDLTHANAASPTYSIGSSSLSSHGGITGYSDKPRAEDSRTNMTRTYTDSPRQPCDSNRHLLSPVPDCLDSDAAAAAAVAAVAAAAAVNSGGEAPVRVPLPTPPASDGTPPERQWHDSIRRAPTASMGGMRPISYSTSSSSSWSSSPVSSTMAPTSVGANAGGNYPAPSFVASFPASSNIMSASSHQPDAMYHELIHPPHIAWYGAQHHHHHQDPYRTHHPSYAPSYNDPFGHSPIPSNSYHHHFEQQQQQPRRATYHPYQHHHHHHHHAQTQQQPQLQNRQPQPSASSPDTVSSSSSSTNMVDSKVVTTTPRRYKCTVCVKRFTRPSSLATHMHSHTGEKPYKCQIEGCGRRFSVVSNLRRHAKIHNSSKSS